MSAFECRGVEFSARPELHMSHVPATAFQESCGIGQASAVEEADADVGGKDTDVGKRNITDACGGQPVVHELPNVGTATAYPSEPGRREGP